MQTQLRSPTLDSVGFLGENVHSQNTENQIRALHKNHTPFSGTNVLFLVKIHVKILCLLWSHCE